MFMSLLQLRQEHGDMRIVCLIVLGIILCHRCTHASVVGYVDDLDINEISNPADIYVSVHTQSGHLLETSPIQSDSQFTLLYIEDKYENGIYVLRVNGKLQIEYMPLLVRVQGNKVVAVVEREHPLIRVPENEKEWGKKMEIRFRGKGTTNYERRSTPWSWTLLWQYRVRLLQLAGIAFVVWFPSVIKDLPKEMREELLGEKEEELGDLNRHINMLLNRVNHERQ